MRHLITGASGFLGTHLANHLLSQPGNEVYSLGIQAPADPRLTHFETDLCDGKGIEKCLLKVQPDRIYHLAGSALVSSSIGMPEYFKANFTTTQTLLDELSKTDLPVRLFFSSSVHVYGDPSTPVDETSEPAPNANYGMSKYLCERALEEWTKQNPKAHSVVGRLYTCIGPGQRPGFVTSDLAHKLAKLPNDGSAALETGPLSARRRFLDVRDAARLICVVLEAPFESRFEIVNIASPFEMQVQEIVERLVKISGKGVPIHPQASDSNPFRGPQLSLKKLQTIAPGFSYLPTDQTLRDIWEAVQLQIGGR